MLATRFVWLAVIVAALLLQTPAWAAEVAEATGLITLRGLQLEAGKVTFHLDSGQFAGSKLKDGKFTIEHMPVGKLKVTIEGDGVSPKFSSEETSPLVVEVAAGSNQFNFELP